MIILLQKVLVLYLISGIFRLLQQNRKEELSKKLKTIQIISLLIAF